MLHQIHYLREFQFPFLSVVKTPVLVQTVRFVLLRLKNFHYYLAVKFVLSLRCLFIVLTFFSWSIRMEIIQAIPMRIHQEILQIHLQVMMKF